MKFGQIVDVDKYLRDAKTYEMEAEYYRMLGSPDRADEREKWAGWCRDKAQETLEAVIEVELRGGDDQPFPESWSA